MKRVIVIACLAASLQACARADTGPSFLGMATAGADGMTPVGDEAAKGTAAPGDQPNIRPELRHVGSNKVLGAMAFQKVTGRAVDPSRLDGSR